MNAQTYYSLIGLTVGAIIFVVWLFVRAVTAELENAEYGYESEYRYEYGDWVGYGSGTPPIEKRKGWDVPNAPQRRATDWSEL